MSEERIALGKRGEDLACRELERLGYAIVARRFRVRNGELDIVARDGSVLVFVEVKTRRSTDFGGPISAVGARKRRHLSRAAIAWMDRHGIPGVEYRFDVIGVLIRGELVRVAHVENAFLEALPR